MSGCANGMACEMSLASASARSRFKSTITISRPTPLITSAYADADPTIPQPTIPVFINRLESDISISCACKSSRRGRSGFHLGTRACRVRFKVFVEQPGKLFRGSIVRSFVSPAFARTQDFRRHAGAFNDNVETEDWIARGLCLCQGTTVNGVDDRACIFKADPFSGAISAAGPPRVNQP